MTYLEAEVQGSGWDSMVISPLLSDSGFKNLQEELASMSKVALETRAIDISLLVYEIQGAISVPLTSVYSMIDCSASVLSFGTAEFCFF